MLQAKFKAPFSDQALFERISKQQLDRITGECGFNVKAKPRAEGISPNIERIQQKKHS